MTLQAIPLFAGLERAQWDALLKSRCMRRRTFAKNTVIFHTGTAVHEVGTVLSGCVHVESIDVWGNNSLLGQSVPGQVFAETYVLCGEPLAVTVRAVEDTEVLFLDLSVVQREGVLSPALRQTLLLNLLRMTARKNLELSGRIFCTTPKTVRERVITYLSAQAQKAGRSDFCIPFNRQQMADYLNLDRSALSKELCRMRDEGLLTFRKNRFELHIPSV